MFNESRYRTELSRYRIECAAKMTGKVLDVGGGIGAWLPYFNTTDVTVLDISEEALERLDWPNKVCADACHTPFEDSMFDNIWACGVAIYFQDSFEDFLTECKRIAKDNGKVILELPNPDSFWNKIKRRIGMRGWEDDPSPYFHMYTIDYLKQFGKLTGEVKFLPGFMDRKIRNKSWFWHTMMLEIKLK